MPQGSKPQCTFADYLQNALASVTNLLYSDVRTLGFSGDFIYDPNSTGAFNYAGGSVGLNSLFQLTYSTTSSATLRGQGAAAIFGAGLTYGFSSGPVTPGQSTVAVAVAGGALGPGLLGSLSRDESGVGGPFPNIGRAHGDVTFGLGLAYAAGDAQQTTYASPPLIPQISRSSCHPDSV